MAIAHIFMEAAQEGSDIGELAGIPVPLSVLSPIDNHIRNSCWVF